MDRKQPRERSPRGIWGYLGVCGGLRQAGEGVGEVGGGSRYSLDDGEDPQLILGPIHGAARTDHSATPAQRGATSSCPAPLVLLSAPASELSSTRSNPLTLSLSPSLTHTLTLPLSLTHTLSL